jgi:NADH-quinone oxidoreductase subunit M
MGLDGLAIFMVLITNVIVPLILLSNYDGPLASNKLFTSMVFLMQMGLLGLFASMDGFMFYIFWEITLIPIFLIALWFGEDERRKALMKFFLYTFIGSLAMLLSLMYIKNNAASFSHEDLVAVQLTSKSAFWVMGGFFLAFAIKSPLFPLHTWQPDTYTKSPMAGTMLLSALMLNMALYGMIKWMIPLAPEAMQSMLNPIVIMGIIGVVYAGIIALTQNDMKRLFAYSSISHVGLIVAGIALYNTQVLSGAVIQIANHSLVAVGMFLSVEIIQRRLQTRNLSELGGIAKLAPHFGFWFAALAFAAISIPFTSGFIGEFILIKNIFSYQTVFGILAGTTLVFGAAYMLRAYQLSMFGSPKVHSFKDLTWSETTVFVLLMAMIVFMGVYPQAVIDLVRPSLEQLYNTVQAANILVQ